MARALSWLLIIANLAIILAATFPWQRALPGPNAFGPTVVTRGFEIWPGLLAVAAAVAALVVVALRSRESSSLRWTALLRGVALLQTLAVAAIIIWALAGVGESTPRGYIVQTRPGAWAAAGALLVSIVAIVASSSSVRAPTTGSEMTAA